MQSLVQRAIFAAAMNIHEYQAKEILKGYGVSIQEGIVIDKKEDALKAGKELKDKTGTDWVVVKAQIHAGGRGKGGGVKLAKNDEELQQVVNDILGMQLITPQTSAEGKKVSKVLLAQDVYYPGAKEPEEYYMSVLLDRSKQQNVIIYTTEGGMDIEEVAETHPEKIHREWVDPTMGLLPFQARKIAFNLGLSGDAFKGMVKFVNALYKAYTSIDASLFEINPVLKTSDDKIIAVDSKVTLDDNALYRHKDYAALRDESEEDPTEVEAKKHGLNFIKLDGNVGCMVNGAGLAMATMDIIKLAGAEPANFLDVGGGANAETVENGFRILLSDPNVKGILINIFGGIVRCDLIAEGIIAAVKEVGVSVPVVVRLEGTNVEKARTMLAESGKDIIAATDLTDAAQKVVASISA